MPLGNPSILPHPASTLSRQLLMGFLSLQSSLHFLEFCINGIAFFFRMSLARSLSISILDSSLLLCISIVYYFLLLNGIPLYVYTMIDSLMDIWVVYSLLQIKLLWMSVYTYVWIDVFLSLGWVPRVVWLDYMVGVCLTFKEKMKLFSKVFFTLHVATSGVWDTVQFQFLLILTNTWYG